MKNRREKLLCYRLEFLFLGLLFVYPITGCSRSGQIQTTGIAAAEASSSNSSDCKHTATRFKCVKYLKNYDGDTLTFQIPDVHPLLGHKISVRVFGLDTPEIKGHLPCEKEAARTAQRLVENLLTRAQRVDLNDVQRDKYFRVLAEVVVDGKSLKDLLMKNKLAYAYAGGTKQKINWCNRGVASE
ncbi:MAG: thermonuclease family protein [Pseudobdellovibrionaceae bacterium]